MAALTGNYDANMKPGDLQGYNLNAGAVIYKGALICVDPADGYAVEGADTATLVFVGVAEEPGDNSAGADGDVGIRVRKSGSFVYNFSGAWAQTLISKAVYIVDDNTVALAATTTNDVLCGYVVALVGTSQVRVRIDRAVQ